MSYKQDGIRAIFEGDLGLFSWRLTENKLKWMKGVIPNSDYFYKDMELRNENSNVYWNTVLRSALKGQKREEAGDTLYMSNDDPAIHWFSMNKKYEFLFDILEPTLKFEGYFESFNSADQIEIAKDNLR